jgi:hypothetical protein
MIGSRTTNQLSTTISLIRSTGLSFLAASSYFQQSSCSSHKQPSFEHGPTNQLDKRIDCSPYCPKGFYVDSVQMPACSWNCITYGDRGVKVVLSVKAGISDHRFRLHWIHSYASHAGTTGKRDIDLSSSKSLVMDLFGDPRHPNITYMDPSILTWNGDSRNGPPGSDQHWPGQKGSRQSLAP